MWVSRETYERLVSEAALALQVPKLELRAEAAEAALAREREESRQSERHLVSMWLRHNRSYPLPPTKEEKAEAKAEKVERDNQSPTLTPDLIARREAVRQYARQQGRTIEEADKLFMAQIGIQSDE